MAREEWAAYVEQACGDDTALRAAVADVLQGADAATFLESPALEFAAPMAVTPRGFTAAHFSPDGRQLATAVVPTDGGQSDIWVLDLTRNTFRRVTFDSGSVSPVWSPNGQRIAFATKPGGRQFAYSIRWVLADGGDSAVTLLAGELAQFPDAFTPDGRALVFQRRDLATGRDIRILPLAMDRNPQPFLRTPFDERGAAVSPDGRWLAYVSDESGRDEVYVRAFPRPGAPVQISAGGGQEPRWAPSFRELFYRSDAGMVVVAVETAATLRGGRREVLFDTEPYVAYSNRAAYDVHPDGRRFLMIRRGSEGHEVVVILNWFDQLRAAGGAAARAAGAGQRELP